MNDLKTTIEALRRLQVRHGDETPGPARSFDEQRALLHQAYAAISPYVMPPQEGVGAKLKKILTQWEDRWTADLTNSPEWNQASVQLSQIRERVRAGDLQDAAYELLELLLAQSDSVRRVAFAQPSSRGQRATEAGEAEPAEPITTEGLLQLITWLERQSAR